MSRVLGLVASSCGGLDTRFAAQLAKPAADRGWELAITLTPTAARWLEKTGGIGDLEACTGLPVRSTSRLPGEPRPHPDPSVFLFAPASANSVAKLALGIADNQALTLLGDVLGTPGITIVLGYQIQDTRVHHPAWRRHLDTRVHHPAWRRHLDTLESAGVTTTRLTPDTSWTSVLDLLPAV